MGPSLRCAYYAVSRPPSRDDDDERPARPSPEELAAAAADRARSLAPAPEIAVAPSGIGLTGLRSFFWLAEEPQPISAVAAVPGLRVEAEARPASYRWDFGDGESLDTESPGKPWARGSPGDIGHTYERRGLHVVTVTITWDARWRIGTGPWRPLGSFTTSSDRDYPVREIIAVLTRVR